MDDSDSLCDAIFQVTYSSDLTHVSREYETSDSATTQCRKTKMPHKLNIIRW